MSESNGLATIQPADLSIMEQVIIKGDLAELKPEERVDYYNATCRSLGLNPFTKPFAYIALDGGLTLYATRDGTDQLRRIYSVNIEIVDRQVIEGVYVVTARATLPDGRADTSTGAVSIVKEDGDWKTSQNGKRYFDGKGTFRPLGPDARANALMKAETKAKRRVTLSICGLGWLDESEIETVPRARAVTVDAATGEIVEAPQSAQAAVTADPVTPHQLARISELMRAKGISGDGLRNAIGKSSRDLSFAEAGALIVELEGYPDVPDVAPDTDGEYVEAPMFAGAGNPGRYTK